VAGGRIEVDARHETGEAVIRVRDDGIGIAPEMMPRIFDLFAQADRALDRAEGGLGNGLTLVRRLVELHGGRVEVDSKEGDGARFTIRLPLRPASGTNVWPPAPAPAALVEEGPQIVVPAESAPSVLPGVEQGKG
jgi:signal transduction histidine kinase